MGTGKAKEGERMGGHRRGSSKAGVRRDVLAGGVVVGFRAERDGVKTREIKIGPQEPATRQTT